MAKTFSVDDSTQDRIQVLAQEYGISKRALLHIILDAADSPDVRGIIKHFVDLYKASQEWERLARLSADKPELKDQADQKLKEIHELAAKSETFLQKEAMPPEEIAVLEEPATNHVH